jgi:dipeptidyl aminopeptidase/acylaminoacyl peptidase
MMHGAEDDRVPYERHARRLLAAAEGHTKVEMIKVEGAGHEDVPYVLGADYARSIISYIDSRATEQ